MRLQTILALALCIVFSGLSEGAEPEAVWQSLFNGRDLTGWSNVNCAPSTWSVREGLIVCTGKPTGVMRTARHYENFNLELEWRHLHPGGNAGLFIYSDPITAPGVPFTRAIEIQVLDGNDPKGMWTGHGDVFSIHGARFVPDRPHPEGWERCLPSERRARPAGEWNHYRVESRDGRISLAVNGKIVSGGSRSTPRRGYICLESEGSEVHFRNLRIQELPSSNPAPTDIAAQDEGFKSLYTGVDLSGWRAIPEAASRWQVKDWILECNGASDAKGGELISSRDYGDFVLIADWRLTGKPEARAHPVILPTGDTARQPDGTPRMESVADAGEGGIILRGHGKAEVKISCWPLGSGELRAYRTDPQLAADVRTGVTPRGKADRPPGLWNRFVITLRGDRLTVMLNGQTVIENAALPGIPARGPITVLPSSAPIQFANLYLRELN